MDESSKTAVIEYRGHAACVRCMMFVDADGRPDMRVYRKESLARYESIPDDQKCRHLRDEQKLVEWRQLPATEQTEPEEK